MNRQIDRGIGWKSRAVTHSGMRNNIDVDDDNKSITGRIISKTENSRSRKKNKNKEKTEKEKKKENTEEK